MKQIHCSGSERVLYSLVWLWLLSERAGRIEGFTVGGPRIRPSPTSTSPHHRVPALNRIGYSPSSSCSRCLYTTRHQYQKESAEDQSSNKKQTRPKRAPKPPRFTQTVHGGGTNAKGDKKKNNNKQEVQKDRMWNSRKKSIEELEVIMNKRWGTSLNTFTAQDYYDDDDEEEEDEDEDIAGNTIRHRNSFNGSSSNSNNNRRLTNRELYQNKLAGDHTKGLQPMADLYQSHILKLGMDIVESRKARLMQPQQQQPPGETNNGKAPPSKKEKNEDSDFCKDLIALHDKFSNVNRETFCNHAYFCRALGESFGKIINMTNVGKFHNAELLSSFCDRVLRGMEKLNQVEVEQISTKIIQLFSYLTDKDIFAETYRVQLAKRLLTINNTTSSSLSSSGNDFEAEKSLISKLKAQCGTQFTSKMEGMLSDLELGAEQRGKFKSALAKEGKPKLDFGVQLLTVGHWPSYKSPENFAVTHEMQAGMEAYKSWYNQYHQNRKIAWVYTQGSANVTAIFANKTYDLTVSTLQAVVLNSFSGGRTLNFDDLKQQLNLEDEQMLRGLLHSLCCGKHRVIAKRSADGKASSSKKISSNDLFMANRKFTSKLRKIRIAMPTLASMEATSAASMAKVEEERKVVIEAAIVRIMKARKTSGHQDLVSEVLKQLTFFGAPNPRVIKRRIEDLIDREYLERSKDEANTYNYLA
mmetsp:Transcript_22305/g.48471  ORF Transcript_22305/g.48471 Transcript_22305/m.48471 type:complete len:696 (-) Transcript_22305:151-2238(-)